MLEYFRVLLLKETIQLHYFLLSAFEQVHRDLHFLQFVMLAIVGFLQSHDQVLVELLLLLQLAYHSGFLRDITLLALNSLFLLPHDPPQILDAGGQAIKEALPVTVSILARLARVQLPALVFRE